MTHHPAVETIPNLALNRHVTDSAFVLTLRKTQISMLQFLRDNGDATTRNTPRDIHRFWVPSTNALIERGLITHQPPSRTGPVSHGSPLKDIFTITRAGLAVITLLEEAGLIPVASIADESRAA